MKSLFLVISLLILGSCAHKHKEKKDHDCHCAKASEAPKPVAFEFDSFCPMGLCRKGEKVKCDPEITLAHQGKTYCFSSLEARETFMKDLSNNISNATKRWKVIQSAGSR